MVNAQTYPATTALSERLAALVTVAEPNDEREPQVGPVLAATLTGLRAEISGMREDLETVRAQAASAPAPVVDDAVESRLAAIEDTLDGLAERFEALARNSTTDAVARLESLEDRLAQIADALGTNAAVAGDRLAAIEDRVAGLHTVVAQTTESSGAAAVERLGSLEDRLAALAQSVQAERTAAGQHRETSTEALQDQAVALDEWADAVRGGLEDLGEAVNTSLGSLSASMTTATTSGRDSERRHVEALMNELATTIEQGLLGVHDRMEVYVAPIDGRLGELHESVLDGFGSARSRLIEELSATIASLEAANLASREQTRHELTALRSDLADALDEVWEKVESTVARHSAAVESTVAGHSETVSDTLAAHQAASESLRAGIETAALNAQDSATRVAGLQETVARLDATLAALQSDWRPQVDAVVAEGRASALSVLEDYQRQAASTLSDLRAAVRSQSNTIDNLSGSLGGSTDRMITAGQALLAYLAERDRLLEGERDRVLHEVLDEFAQGLSAKERRAASSRMSEALDRRRDVRDAERFRRTAAGKPAIEIPPIPAELAELSEPVVPVIPPPPPVPKPTVTRRPAARKTTPAKPTAVAETPTTPTKTSAKKTSAPAAKKTATARKPAATTAAKKAAATKPAAQRSASSRTPRS